MTRGPALRAAAALAVAVITGVLMASCGVPGNALAEQLLGREFKTGGPADVTGYDLVPGSQLTLAFYRDHDNADAFGGDAGCNSMGAAAAWDGNTVRAADGLTQTEMACEGLMGQEAWWAGLLTSGITLALDGGTLTVTANGEGGPVTIRMTESVG
jgi:heat shock protein HslJ